MKICPLCAKSRVVEKYLKYGKVRYLKFELRRISIKMSKYLYQLCKIKLMSHNSFGGGRSSAGSCLFALLQGLSFSARLFGPLAFSGCGHRGTSVLSANFTLPHGLLGGQKIRREDRHSAFRTQKA